MLLEEGADNQESGFIRGGGKLINSWEKANLRKGKYLDAKKFIPMGELYLIILNQYTIYKNLKFIVNIVSEHLDKGTKNI